MKTVILLIMIISLSVAAEKKKQFECGEKKTCKQITSCKEAMFYLNECGLKKLDRNNDGIPCEKICGKK